jgi:hypothetical protein
MTNYNLKAFIPPSVVAQQKKEARRKVLEAVWERRKENYKRFREKREAVASSQ